MTPASRQSRLKISEWRSEGDIETQFGRERKASAVASARSVGIGVSKTRGFVTTRKKPLRTRSDMPYVDSDSTI